MINVRKIVFTCQCLWHHCAVLHAILQVETPPSQYGPHPHADQSATSAFVKITFGNHPLKTVKSYISYCKSVDSATNRPYSSRYIGSMIADFHRNLLKGGIYMYPSSINSPNGKLRLLYECNPMAFIIEQAGGKASDGQKRILEIKPTYLHQRTPFFAGSILMVEKLEEVLLKD